MWYHTNFLKLPIYYIEHVSNYSSYFITILNITKEKKIRDKKQRKLLKYLKPLSYIISSLNKKAPRLSSKKVIK